MTDDCRVIGEKKELIRSSFPNSKSRVCKLSVVWNVRFFIPSPNIYLTTKVRFGSCLKKLSQQKTCTDDWRPWPEDAFQIGTIPSLFETGNVFNAKISCLRGGAGWVTAFFGARKVVVTFLFRRKAISASSRRIGPKNCSVVMDICISFYLSLLWLPPHISIVRWKTFR